MTEDEDKIVDLHQTRVCNDLDKKMQRMKEISAQLPPGIALMSEAELMPYAKQIDQLVAVVDEIDELMQREWPEAARKANEITKRDDPEGFANMMRHRAARNARKKDPTK